MFFFVVFHIFFNFVLRSKSCQKYHGDGAIAQRNSFGACRQNGVNDFTGIHVKRIYFRKNPGTISPIKQDSYPNI